MDDFLEHKNMGLFEDLCDNQQRSRHISQQVHALGRQNNHHGNHRDRYDGHDSHYSHRRDRDELSHIGTIARKLVSNKTLLVLVGLVLVVALGLIIAALVFLLPLVPKLLGYLESNGLQGLLEQGMGILGKVLAVGGR
jgi:hypothetical protein